MRDENEPMPLSELSGYIDSVRREGQGDYVPVVDMGRIVDDGHSTIWFRKMGYAASFLLVLVLGGALTYTAASTRDITIVSDDLGSDAVARLVADEGGRVFSVMRGEKDGTYKVRVLTFDRIGTLLDRLRENKNLKKVDLGE